MQFCRSEKILRIRDALVQSVFNIKRHARTLRSRVLACPAIAKITRQARRTLCVVLACFTLSSTVFGDYIAAETFAAEVGAIVAVDLIAELAISGGIVAAIFRTAEIIQGEVTSGYGFGSDGLDDFVGSMNQQLIDGVNNGSITNSDAGHVNKVSGVPVEIICPVYGTYQFLCTNELCNKIRSQSPLSEAQIQALVNTYWSSINILDQRSFEEIAADPRNWVSSLDVLNLGSKSMVSQSVFDAYGEVVSAPADEFFETGNYGYWIRPNAANINMNLRAALLNENYDYFVLKIPDYNGLYQVRCYYYNPAVGDFIYHAGTIENGRTDFSFIVTNGLKEIAMTKDRFESLILDNMGALDITEVFPNWGDLCGIEATDAIDLLDWIYADGRFWNTDVLDLAVDEIADTVDARVESGEDAGVQDIPIGLPIDIPIEGEGDVAWPSDLTDEDFDDPPAYPRTDEWADADVDFPPYNPTPEDPDPEEPDPDNPGSEEPGPRPELMLPVLGGLFPFCIPQDVYNTIRVFNSTAQEPVWDIPLNLTVANRQLTNTTLHIDLTEYGLDGFFSTLRAVQIVIFIVGLAVFTKQFIF